MYNRNKSYSLCFKPTSIKFERPCFYLGEKIIPKVTQCKYLGVIISDHNCDADLKRQMRKFYTNANMLIRNFLSVLLMCNVIYLKRIVLLCTVLQCGLILQNMP